MATSTSVSVVCQHVSVSVQSFWGRQRPRQLALVGLSTSVANSVNCLLGLVVDQGERAGEEEEEEERGTYHRGSGGEGGGLIIEGSLK